MFKFLKEANVPYARLHDVGGRFGGNVFVDIPNLFRDFDADETDSANYDFTFTDRYLKALVENGVEPYFRLGVTIEVFARTVKAYRIFPPKDFAKWARICEHVIRHYTEGWADGFRYKITYWEIWNEPDDYPDSRNAMWRGTWRQFCEFYEVASKHLKAKFPHLKIGGYGKCTAFSAFVMYGDDPPEEDAYRHKCFVEFCDFIKERKCPLDFFSFHAYIQPDHVRSHVDYHRRILRNAGYGDAEIICDEWNYDPIEINQRDRRYGAKQTAMLLMFQNSDIDRAYYYHGGRTVTSLYTGLFAPDGSPSYAYYGFWAFGQLYRLGSQAAITSKPREDLYAVAATGDDGQALLIANISKDKDRRIRLKAGKYTVERCMTVNEKGEWVEIPLPKKIESGTMLYITFKANT